MLRHTLIAVALLAATAAAHAGVLDGALKDAAERLTRRGVNEAADKTYDAAKDGASKKAPDAAKPGATPAPAEAAKAGGSTLTGANEQVYSKYDFIPGDKVIFFDDFSDTDVGEFPRKWHLKGPKAGRNNAVEVVEFQGKRFLRARPASGEEPQDSATQYLRLTQKGDLPEKFTIEFDAVLGFSKHEYANRYVLYLLHDEGTWPGLSGSPLPGTLAVSGNEGISVNSNTAIRMNDGKVHHVAVSVNGTFVKAYVDNERVVNDPDALQRPIKLVGLFMESGGGLSSDRVMFTNFRLAAGGKEVRSALTTDGRIVTHGILFDTAADKLKPESLPTLRMILALLTEDPQLRFSIEGHTDNQGNPGINQPLSERRAAAVKDWLVGKGIPSERMKTRGLGDTKPIDANQTGEGRANNRRVEFVKF
jgi:outer membrane protein OmpA-like peptidoglycan-associated protein